MVVRNELYTANRVKMLKRYATKYKKIQKRRYTHRSPFTFNFWSLTKETYFPRNIYIYFTRAFFIKLKFFKRLRRHFRKRCRRRKIAFLFFCKPNFLIHEKFKNARMGKGKGAPTNWVYKPKIDKPCAILMGVNRVRAKDMIRYLQKHVSPNLLVRRNF